MEVGPGESRGHAVHSLDLPVRELANNKEDQRGVLVGLAFVVAALRLL